MKFNETVVTTTLAVVRDYFRLYDIDADVTLNRTNGNYVVTYNTSFKMPTGDGGYYWETEVSSRMEYEWPMSENALEWVIKQAKGANDDS